MNRNTMTAVALAILTECYYMGTDLIGVTAVRREAVNSLIRAGLVKFRDAQVPENGLEITERGHRHVERILALPIMEAQEGAQGAPGSPAPRYAWGYDPEMQAGAADKVIYSAGEALNTMVAANGTFSNPVATSIFLEALTWDQQTRVLERLGFKKVA